MVYSQQLHVIVGKGVIFPTFPVFMYITCNFLIEEKETDIN